MPDDVALVVVDVIDASCPAAPPATPHRPRWSGRCASCWRGRPNGWWCYFGSVVPLAEAVTRLASTPGEP